MDQRQQRRRRRSFDGMRQQNERNYLTTPTLTRLPIITTSTLVCLFLLYIHPISINAFITALPTRAAAAATAIRNKPSSPKTGTFLHTSTESSSNPSPQDGDNKEHSPFAPPSSFTSPLPLSPFAYTLAIVPPEQYWDTLQRARFMAGDPTYHRWPPCLRLFHPFPYHHADRRLDQEIAQLIEKYDIEPFTVRLDQWVVMPHVEQMEWEMLHNNNNKEEEERTGKGPKGGSEEGHAVSPVDALIEREAEIGRRRKDKRISRRKKKQQQRQRSAEDVENKNKDDNQYEATNDQPQGGRDKHNVQHKAPPSPLDMFEGGIEGPCILCLEPDKESSRFLIELRDMLAAELFGREEGDEDDEKTKFSSASSFSNTIAEHATGEFRPLIPIGMFPSYPRGLDMARKLKKLWKPLTFPVTELLLLSCWGETLKGGASSKTTPTAANDNDNDNVLQHWMHSSHKPHNEEFGCDVAIMLMGEEIEGGDGELIVDYMIEEDIPFDDDNADHAAAAYDDDDNDGTTITDVLLLDAQIKRTNSGNEEEEDGSNLDEFAQLEKEMLAWLDEDDDDDDAWYSGVTKEDLSLSSSLVVVQGRCHYFSGAARQFAGMPACAAMDVQKERSAHSTGRNWQRPNKKKPSSENGSRPKDQQ